MSIQTPQQKTKFSRLRQRLRQAAQEIEKLVEPFMSDKPVVKGSVYELRRKCGRKNCACTKGELHASTALSFTEGGRKRLKLVPKGKVGEVKAMAGRYRTLREARARLVKLHGEMVTMMDEMEAMRREGVE